MHGAWAPRPCHTKTRSSRDHATIHRQQRVSRLQARPYRVPAYPVIPTRTTVGIPIPISQGRGGASAAVRVGFLCIIPTHEQLCRSRRCHFIVHGYRSP